MKLHIEYRIMFALCALVLTACNARSVGTTNNVGKAAHYPTTRTAMAAPTAAPTPDTNSSDLQFILKDTYKVGQVIAVQIKNSGNVAYSYQVYYAACYLSYYDDSGRKFLIPPGTHCDIWNEVEIQPGETVTLFHWDLSDRLSFSTSLHECKEVRKAFFTYLLI